MHRYPHSHWRIAGGRTERTKQAEHVNSLGMRPRIQIVPIVLETRQAKVPGDPGNIGRAVIESLEAACYPFSTSEPLRSDWSGPRVNPFGFAVVCVEASRKISEAGSERRIHLLQFGSELVAFRLRLLVGELAPMILLLGFEFAQPISQLGNGRLHAVAPKRGVLHLAAGYRDILGGQCGIERPLPRVLSCLSSGHCRSLSLADQLGHVIRLRARRAARQSR
jgi:hypothetical protein